MKRTYWSWRDSRLLVLTLLPAYGAGCKDHGSHQAAPGPVSAHASPVLVTTAAHVLPVPSATTGLHVGAAPAAPVASTAAAQAEAARAIERSCKSICERSETLHCAHAADCRPNCLAMAVGTPCSEEFAALYRCLVSEPVAHWECAEDGVAGLRDGFCEKEQERSVGCMEAKAP